MDVQLCKLFSRVIMAVLLVAASLSAYPALALEADGSDVEIKPDKPSITGVALAKLPVNYDPCQTANVNASIELMKEFGWTEQAENALKWLNDKKIYADNLPAGTRGHVNPFNGDITLDTSLIGSVQFDRNTWSGFSNLLELAATLMHEKVHAHQSFVYKSLSNMKSAPFQIFNREHPAEQDAYTQQFVFLDTVITALVRRIGSNKEAPRDKMIQMFQELSLALGQKAGGIRGYYTEHPNYGPIPWTTQRAGELEEFRWQVLDQLDKLMAGEDVDWELFEKLAEDYRVAEAPIEAEAEEWLAGAPQRSASAEESVVVVGALESINGMVAKSIEFGPSDWFSVGRLVSDLFCIDADPIYWDPPATLTINLSPEVISDVDKINVYRFEPEYGHWEKLTDGRSVAGCINTISVKISSLSPSIFGVFQEALGGCFIATAAYGTPMAEEVQILREFRDQYLLTNSVGQALVDLYYKVSPPIAEFITEHPSLKPIVRAGLLPAVVIGTVAVNNTLAEKTTIAGLLVLVSVAVAIWAIRRRGQGSECT